MISAKTAPPVSPRPASVIREAAGDGIVLLDGQEVYRIVDHDKLPPFLMSVVSAGDCWMYISSRGGLTAGRVDPDRCLFPYETEDKLHCALGFSGPLTILRVRDSEGTLQVWEPFVSHCGASVSRNLYKNLLGNQLTFEEIQHDLGLTFRYRWSSSDEFGFVRGVTLHNHGAAATRVEWIDGLLNIVPAGINLAQQQQFSSLTDAYKYSELDAGTGLGVFSLAAMITDRAEPAEALRASVAWCRGLKPTAILLSTEQLDGYRNGNPVATEPLLKGGRGSYLVCSSAQLKPGESCSWDIVADVNQTQAQVEQLRARILGDANLKASLRASVEASNEALTRTVASADGMQAAASKSMNAHHYANVLFNVMRGGIFAKNYVVPEEDFCDFVRHRNQGAFARHKSLFKNGGEEVAYADLLQRLEQSGDADLVRLGHEYLPLTFSRRHGDPSRPWNRFNICVKRDDGRPLLSYQGNWRDIFQNWEALCVSYHGFLESIIAKFVNASTVDGFNPYRVTREGIDWEVPDPRDPWSHIGYWGDHQIIYLVKFMEASRRFHPGLLAQWLQRPIFSYANVPYRLNSYASIRANPRETIRFDEPLEEKIKGHVKSLGTDGKLVLDRDGRVLHVNLTEKLLVSVLSRLGNFVVDGGIWMNTQRPEWNDANNALVGFGVSMVTLCYLRRYLACCLELLSSAEPEVEISEEVAQWLEQTRAILQDNQNLLKSAAISGQDRKRILDALGTAFEKYRSNVYADGLSGKTRVRRDDLKAFFQSALEYVDHGIRANRRPDKLYHAYNLLDASADGQRLEVEHLYEMLEGQVAALSSGLIGADETLELLEALFKGPLYRADQQSFILYPDRALPGFLQKNIVPHMEVESNPLLMALLQAGDATVIACDVQGQYRFHAGFRNGHDLQEALAKLSGQDRWAALVTAHGPAAHDLYERVFKHRAFTGRSGSMFCYEGLGCIYWHMVAKLLLAVQESFLRAQREGQPKPKLTALAEAYYRVRQGLGFNKSVREYGAFPTDPYSHTPGRGGARQPGMTGQVKEEILARWGELGVVVEDGRLAFQPSLLRRRELLTAEQPWSYFNVAGQRESLTLPVGSLAFTFCQVPVVYQRGPGGIQITVTDSSGGSQTRPGGELDATQSAAIFNRLDHIRRIDVTLPDATFLLD